MSVTSIRSVYPAYVNVRVGYRIHLLCNCANFDAHCINNLWSLIAVDLERLDRQLCGSFG